MLRDTVRLVSCAIARARCYPLSQAGIFMRFQYPADAPAQFANLRATSWSRTTTISCREPIEVHSFFSIKLVSRCYEVSFLVPGMTTLGTNIAGIGALRLIHTSITSDVVKKLETAPA